MLYLIVALLAFGLVGALIYIFRLRTLIHDLRNALEKRTPIVRELYAGESSGEWVRLCTSANDLLAELSQLQRHQTGQLAQLETTLGSLQEAVLIVDANNYILLANSALQAIFPRAKNILNQRLESVLHSVAFLDYVDSVRTGPATPQREIEFVEGSDSVWVEATGSLIASLNGQAERWALFVLHDITKQKKLESVRKDFVANVSHELRPPLSVIKGYVETLVDGHLDMPVSDRTRFLSTLQRHTERLNSLLEDLLTLSRLESINPHLHRESVALSELIAGLIDDYRARTDATEHRLVLALDPAVGNLLIDPLKITQVFENLLDNALKYTPKKSMIEISARNRGTEVEVIVRDNGPGIPAEDIPHIFERFYRVDKGRSRDKGGTGLGLSIVKHIVQLHGGRVWVESQLGKGTSFHFSLPLQTAV